MTRDEEELQAVDVVVAPDFTNQRARTFTLRTLFFLASWQLYAGAYRDSTSADPFMSRSWRK